MKLLSEHPHLYWFYITGLNIAIIPALATFLFTRFISRRWGPFFFFQ